MTAVAPVKGHIENLDEGPRSLKVNLDEHTYHQAVTAHDTGTSVQVTALVRRDRRSIHVVRVEHLAILGRP